VSDPDQPKVVVSPNDGTIYHVARCVELETEFWLKEQPYSLQDMLAGSDLTETFVHGDVLQSYLSGADYHRWHSPVAGKILATDVVEGLMFSNLSGLGNGIKGVSGQGFYAAVNTRGLVFIESDYKPLGIVCVMPVGITEISSIMHMVAPGDHVAKGQEIGRFSYGGSSMAVLFQPGAIDFFDVSDPSSSGDRETIKVNAAVAVAN
jgi:phosphatidylserine decarboxylase